MAALPGITGEPKVTDLERHISVEEHVAQLEVPVENPLQVNVPTQFADKKSMCGTGSETFGANRD